MSDKLTSLLSACAITVALFAATAPAGAKDGPIVVTAPEESVPVRHVSYRDLNLARADHERVLVKRVRSAAKAVCFDSMPGALGHEAEYVGCRTQAWNGASPQIDRAVARARDIAANGWSAIAPVAITISAQ